MLSQEERGAKRGLDSASAVLSNGYISSEDVYLFVNQHQYQFYQYFNSFV